LPASLERQKIVSGHGPNDLILCDRHRWGASLAATASSDADPVQAVSRDLGRLADDIVNALAK
jgi:uncharacterized protein (DUF2342 family)